VQRTGDIGLFKIESEKAVAAGVRRIDALTGEKAEARIAQEEQLLEQAASTLRVNPEELPARLGTLVEERRRLDRELADLRRKLATAGRSGGGGEPEFHQVDGVNFAPRVLEGVPAKELKSVADDLKKKMGSGVVALASRTDGRASLVVGVTPDLTDRFNAVDLVRIGSQRLGGQGGGGRPDMAQAGGPDAAKAEAALAAIEEAMRARTKAA
jgi:alanyl-tRNA synthetase